MSESATSASSSAPGSAPVDASERVVLLDVLRGFALWGVFVSNSLVWLSGRVLLPKEQAKALAEPLLEQIISGLYVTLVTQKFISIFAFLFGLGFSIQLGRAEARGTSAVPLYRRRLGVLLCIGLAHALLVWTGDILHVYALVGLVLMAFRARSHRTVLFWALGLVTVMPFLVPAAIRYLPILMHGAEAAAAAVEARQAHIQALFADSLAALSSESFWTAQMGNARLYLSFFGREPRQLLWMSLILGRFLFGLLAGRLLLLQDVEKHRPLLRRILGWGLLLGLVINGGGYALMRLNAEGALWNPKGPWTLVLSALQEPGYIATAAAYVAGFALLFQRERWRRWMSVLSPVGRMALTNYLMQSVVSIWIYNGWGLGLIGKLPMSRALAICCAVFALQVVFSHLWLARFRFGPVEWLWRSLTYGRVQPLRRAAGEGSSPGVAAS
ncbi:DUF418 domain-containing protein [Comamonas sp. JC664]|uniref:DUF418 domain-containing protein n=1 Tax=Comamonas sp. JC664 TaxID=2801917 RepID=UPI00174EA044|nr:DUF418 domain-containing protein [Comamonas sp. JC664]MBL0696939.1 DUF418 domain-containing protein [Comamonas sp. JC664]